MTIRSDNPIRRPEDDALGRTTAAISFAQQVLGLDAGEGVVVGVLGPWGSGKTSFVNLARNEFERLGVTVLDFNPWMFSGAEQLVESFFIELASQLKLQGGLAEAGKALEEYGEAFSQFSWLPVLGPLIEHGGSAAKLIGKILSRREEGVLGRRSRLEAALAAIQKPIVVVLDDIDRLSTSEIRDILKLVRLTASFPNIVYVVEFDRKRVEEALGEQGVPGRDYLEKILQLIVDLPAIPPETLNRQVFSALDEVLATSENVGTLNMEVWPDVFMEIIRPLIRNMRDVRRYALAVRGTITVLSGQVALSDVLALESVRIFLPDVFGQFHSSVEALTATSRTTDSRNDASELKVQIDSLVRAAGPNGKIVQALVTRLFPAAQRHIGGSTYGADWKARWLRERRIAHEDILGFYLERVAGEGLEVFRAAEQAWSLLADRNALDSYLRSLDPNRLQDTIASLEVYEDQFEARQVVPATIVLLNLLPDIPVRRRGLFDFGPDLAVGRVTLRLLRSLKNPAAVETAVKEILPELHSLSSKLEIIDTVGYRKDVGHKLVSEAFGAELEQSWRTVVRSAPPNELLKEPGLLGLLLLTKRMAGPSEEPVRIDDSTDFTITLLKSARTETLSQGFGSRAVRRYARLAWEALVELYGDEETLRKRIESLLVAKPEGGDEVLELAAKYLQGWRPDRHGE